MVRLFFKMFRGINRLFLFTLVAVIMPIVSLAAKDWPQNFEVSLDDKSEATTKAKADLISSLAAVIPPKKGQKTVITSDNRYILCGDLFLIGRAYALVEINGVPSGDGSTGKPIGVGFASWDGKQWVTRGLWKINPIWRPEGWERTGDDYFPITPATKAFWMLSVTPDKPPLAIVVGDIWKYWQEHYIARLHIKTNKLEFIEETKKAESVGGYLRLYSDSGHRSTFQAWEFDMWTGEKLVPRGYWYDGLGKSEENSLLQATSYSADGSVMAEYQIETEDASTYTITRNEKPYATVKINRPNNPGTGDESEEAYFFEKLTGLPRKLYPPSYQEAKPKRLEDVATINVTGDADAIKRLAFPQKK